MTTMATDPLAQPERAAPPAAGARRSRASRVRERSLLLNPAPVVAAALAAFCLALGGLTVQLITGHDPALGTLASASPLAGKGAGATLTTRASGAGRGASAAPAGHGRTAPLVTSSSGSPATGRTSSGQGDA
jgi:hypothetical protein